MIEDYLEQLKSADPVQRRQAIIALGKSGDERALRPLAALIKTDPDPVLRELALRAGKHIRGLSAQTSLKPPAATPPPAQPVSPFAEQPASPAPFVEEQPAVPVQPPPEDQPYTFAFIQSGETALDAAAPEQPRAPARKPGKQDKELAKGRLDAAIGLKLQGNNDRALVALADALRLDPDIASETVVINLATGITGISSPKDALQAVTAQAEAAKAASRKKPGGAAGSAAGDTLLEIVILFVVMIAVAFVLVLALSRAFPTIIQEYARGEELRNPFRDATMAALLVSAVVDGGVTTVITVLSGVVTYAVGSFLGGVGDVFRVIRAIARVQAVSIVLFTIPYAVFLYTLSSKPAIPGEALAIFDLVLGLGTLIAWVMAVAKAHEVSVMRGCAITLVSGVVEGCLFAFLAYLIYSSQIQAIR